MKKLPEEDTCNVKPQPRRDKRANSAALNRGKKGQRPSEELPARDLKSIAEAEFPGIRLDSTEASGDLRAR